MKILTEEAAERWRKELLDPWPRMAIEEQFRPLVNAHFMEPATLQYIEDHMDEWASEYKDILEVIWEQLHEMLRKRQYAMALKKILWEEEEELTMDEAMELVLYEPDDLMERIISFVEN